MQRKKNIRLLISLAALVTLAVILAWTAPTKNRIDVDRDMFSYDPAEIDRVILQVKNGETNELAFSNGLWMVNTDYKADPQRVSVLFAILDQAKVRRKAPLAEMEELSNGFDQRGITATYYEGADPVKEFEVLGDTDRGVTYYRDGDNIYLIEIPGYRNYLAGLYELDENGWRYPRVFDFNWVNLKRVDVSYAGGEGFGISMIDGFYRLEELQATDTSKVTDFLDNLSLMYVNDFLNEEESSAMDSLKSDLRSTVVVQDVGNNDYTLEVLGALPGKSEILVRIDSATYALASLKLLNNVLKPRNYFIEKEPSE